MGKQLNLAEHMFLHYTDNLKLKILAAELRKVLPIKRNPNVYDWQGVKAFFSDICGIQFNVPMNSTNNDNNRYKESMIGPRLWYNIEEKNGRKIIQFNIQEPSDEDDLKVYLYSERASNYMEVLKTLFFEFVSIAEIPFSVQESFKIGKEFNCEFMLQMLIPQEEYFKASHMFTTNSILDMQKMADYFNLTWYVIENRRCKFVRGVELGEL